LFPFHIGWVHTFLPDHLYPPPSDEAKYQQTVAKLRTQGMEALGDEERRLLLAISWYARLMQEETVRYRVVERDASSAIVRLEQREERYRLETARSLIATRVLHEITPATDYRPDQAQWPKEVLYFVENADGSEEVVATEWQRFGDEWICARGKANIVYLWGLMLYVGINRGFVESQPVGMETVNSRPAYKLEAPTGSPAGLWGGKPRFYWVDVEQLLPVQEEESLDNGNTLVVTTLELNPDIEISAPDIDITCEERAFDPY
jgi:hypothetical protein